MQFSRKARRELFRILLLTVCLMLLYILTFGDGGFVRLHKYQVELRELQLENLRLHAKHQADLEKITQLKSNPSEVERIARERYNFARPGDIIVNLQNQKALEDKD